MFQNLRLQNFKNFRDATLSLGPFTVLFGANAAGKSNLRDAFRFLHGIGRGYSLPEIVGQKWGEGGELQWRGIRGGIREIAYRDSITCGLEVEVGRDVNLSSYRIALSGVLGWHALIRSEEQLRNDGGVINLGRFSNDGVSSRLVHHYYKLQPYLPDMAENYFPGSRGSESAKQLLSAFKSMRFLDLNPEAMRLPSIPGLTVLGDRGENLSSVLQAICADPARKSVLIDWVAQLTPMDVKDFDFESDPAGRILVVFVEQSGQRISAYSASDGTLRFLALIAALLGPSPARFYFIEEIEAGIHPARLSLLIDLIETQTAKGEIQVVATTHAPDLLALLNETSRNHASLVYRLPGEQEGRIRRVVEIPAALDALQRQDLGRLHAYGWFEDAVFFTEAEGDPP